MGKLAPEGAEKGTFMSEVYVKGTEPKDTAPLENEITESNLTGKEYED
jgi:hypothetical protein